MAPFSTSRPLQPQWGALIKLQLLLQPMTALALASAPFPLTPNRRRPLPQATPSRSVEVRQLLMVSTVEGKEVRMTAGGGGSREKALRAAILTEVSNSSKNRGATLVATALMLHSCHSRPQLQPPVVVPPVVVVVARSTFSLGTTRQLLLLLRLAQTLLPLKRRLATRVVVTTLPWQLLLWQPRSPLLQPVQPQTNNNPHQHPIPPPLLPGDLTHSTAAEGVRQTPPLHLLPLPLAPPPRRRRHSRHQSLWPRQSRKLSPPTPPTPCWEICSCPRTLHHLLLHLLLRRRRRRRLQLTTCRRPLMRSMLLEALGPWQQPPRSSNINSNRWALLVESVEISWVAVVWVA